MIRLAGKRRLTKSELEDLRDNSGITESSAKQQRNRNKKAVGISDCYLLFFSLLTVDGLLLGMSQRITACADRNPWQTAYLTLRLDIRSDMCGFGVIVINNLRFSDFRLQNPH